MKGKWVKFLKLKALFFFPSLVQQQQQRAEWRVRERRWRLFRQFFDNFFHYIRYEVESSIFSSLQQKRVEWRGRERRQRLFCRFVGKNFLFGQKKIVFLVENIRNWRLIFPSLQEQRVEWRGRERRRRLFRRFALFGNGSNRWWAPPTVFKGWIFLFSSGFPFAHKRWISVLFSFSGFPFGRYITWFCNMVSLLIVHRNHQFTTMTTDII